MKFNRVKRARLLWLLCTALTAGCATAPQRTHVPLNAVVGKEIAHKAVSLLGRPYRYGGAGPDAFDCSGLVRFIHDELGIEVPRTAAEQYRAAHPVKMADLRAGDLLFFRVNGSGISHVAIYTGDGRFVHAPQTGRSVEVRELDDVYYRPRLAGAGRTTSAPLRAR